MPEPEVSFFDPLVLKVERSIYTTVAPLEITAWGTPEPVPFPDRTSGVQQSLALGQAWATRLFDCAWLRFRGELPVASGPDPLVARIDVNGELCLVDAEGVPIRGLTAVKSTYDRTLGGPAKTIYRLTKASVGPRSIELWADAGLNDLFGALTGGGLVVLAEIARCNEAVRQLYYDLETLRDYHEGLPSGGRLACELQTDIEAVARELDCTNAASVAQARARVRSWFMSKDKPNLRISAIGHAHLDLAWLWPIRETIRKGARTFASVLYNLEHYPEYFYGCSQPQLYQWMKSHYPELYSRIKEAVRTGRIEPQGNFWVEPDCNLPSGESFVRQILHGSAFFRDEFGTEQTYCWQPDVFGYNGQLPQILRRSGHDFFVTQKLSWNVVNRFPHHSFHWEGIDGTSILAHMLPEETYNGPAAARSSKKIGDEYAERTVSNHALMVFGIGDGGGGPDAEHLERLRRTSGLPGLPVTVIEPVTRFLATWQKDQSEFPRWRGELYLERHQGTLTTQARVKRYNRQAEIALRETEWAAFLATHYGVLPYPAPALDRLWKEVLLYQFHDILPGSSIKRVYDECHARYEIILAELALLKAKHYTAAAARTGQSGPVIFNSFSWPRAEWLKHSGSWHRVVLPALGWQRLPAPTTTFGAIQAAPNRLENEYLRVRFAASGQIDSIFHKATAREMIAAGEPANRFVVYPDHGDAWDFESDYVKKDVWLYLARAGQTPALQSSRHFVDGPCATMEQSWTFGSSQIRQAIRLQAGSAVLEFATEVDWREPATMLRVKFPVAVRSDSARFEIPFGSIRRSTLTDTLVHKAQLEVAALQWIDLSEASHGVALLNDCKHGFRVKGHCIDLNLIRSVPHPGNALITKGNKSGDASQSVYTDLTTHHFKYALLPHADPGDAAVLTQAAREFNTPLAIYEARALGTGRSIPISPVTISSAAIELAAVKPTEDGKSWAFRVVNVTENPVEAELHLAEPGGNITECDLRERTTGPSRTVQGAVPLTFGPFEIKTLRWTPTALASGKIDVSRE